MAIKPRKSEKVVLLSYKTGLENVMNIPEIQKKMIEHGYGETKIAEGKELHTKANSLYLSNKDKATHSKNTWAAFNTKWKELQAVYRMHRKKAKIAFHNERELAEQLPIKSPVPTKLADWMEQSSLFYTNIANNKDLSAALLVLKVDDTAIKKAQADYKDLEAARFLYIKAKDESQNERNKKDLALKKLANWMSLFYRTARLALADDLQLLESFDKLMPSKKRSK